MPVLANDTGLHQLAHGCVITVDWTNNGKPIPCKAMQVAPDFPFCRRHRDEMKAPAQPTRRTA